MGQVKLLKVRESDGAPSLPDVRELILPNGSITDLGNGAASISDLGDIPAGGAANTFLKKVTSADYDDTWFDLFGSVNTWTAEGRFEERLLVNPGGTAPAGSSILFEVRKDGGSTHISVDYFGGVTMGQITLQSANINQSGAATSLTTGITGQFVSNPVVVLHSHKTNTGAFIAAQRGSSTDAIRDVWSEFATWVDQTDATRTGRYQLGVYSTTTFQEGIRVDANSGGVRLGLYGVTAVARQTLSAAATDAATTMALVNEIRAALIALGPCQ